MKTRSLIKVLIVDDHKVVRVGLRKVLDETDDVRAVGEAWDSASALSKARECRPDVVLLDIRLPDADGFVTCTKLKDESPSVKVLMLTSVADDQVILQAIASGADGYLLKAIEDIDIPDAIRKVASGNAMLDPVVTRLVFQQIQTNKQRQLPGKVEMLSVQERRVLELVATGKTNKEIAQKLNLGEKTVRNYLSSVFEKLHVARRSEAAALYSSEMTRKD